MSQSSGDKTTGFRVARGLVLFIYGFAIVCTVILAMAFFLELFNANDSTPFVRWVFRATDRIMQPFRGIFPAVEGESGSVFDPALLFAIFMYWLLALGMSALIGWIDRKIVAARHQQQWEAVQASTASATPRPTTSSTPPPTPPAVTQPGEPGPRI